jgi:hypothetical protein
MTVSCQNLPGRCDLHEGGAGTLADIITRGAFHKAKEKTA